MSDDSPSPAASTASFVHQSGLHAGPQAVREVRGARQSPRLERSTASGGGWDLLSNGHQFFIRDAALHLRMVHALRPGTLAGGGGRGCTTPSSKGLATVWVGRLSAGIRRLFAGRLPVGAGNTTKITRLPTWCRTRGVSTRKSCASPSSPTFVFKGHEGTGRRVMAAAKLRLGDCACHGRQAETTSPCTIREMHSVSGDRRLGRKSHRACIEHASGCIGHRRRHWMGVFGCIRATIEVHRPMQNNR